MATAVFNTRKVVGDVVLKDTGRGAQIVASFTKLPPGEHGFHIHKAGDLRGEGCKGACDHYNKGEPQDHGGPPGTPGQRHTGDLGNISGVPFEKTYYLKDVTVSDLFGRSFIVHADRDDLGKGGEEDSLKTGHAGARIACAIIGRT
jgi:Cu-Zn family superoxide dismutase